MIVHAPSDITIDQIKVPASKSYAQRAILMAALSKGESRIKNVGRSDDVENILQVARCMGASVVQRDDVDEWKIRGFEGTLKSNWIVGESGLGARLAIPLAAVFSEQITIEGHGSLLARPMTVHTEALPKLGVDLNHNNSLLPIQVKGPIIGGEIHVDGSASSQYISGLLMALPMAKTDSRIIVNHLASRPYLDMTMDLLKQFGISISENEDVFQVAGNQQYASTNYIVEGDWSGATFWLVYGAIHRPISIKGLNKTSQQADRALLDLLKKVGATVEWQDDILLISPNGLQSFEFDAWHCPDLFPALVVLAAGIEGESIIHGVDRLMHKESDRGAVLKEEFSKLGLIIDITGNKMIVHGTGKLKSGAIHSNNDHRIAMAGAIAALLTEQGIEIHQAESVNKSYPEFWQEWQ